MEYILQPEAVKTYNCNRMYIIELIKERAHGRTDGQTDRGTLFELIFQNYAVNRQPLSCTYCARAQNVSQQSCHLGPNGKIREKMQHLLYYFRIQWAQMARYRKKCNICYIISEFSEIFCSFILKLLLSLKFYL